MLKAREWLYELLEEVSGARLTHSYVRVGGVVERPARPSFDAKLRDILARTRSRDASTSSKLLNRNRIFRDRMDGIGIITQGRRARVRLHRPGRRARPASTTTSARTTRTSVYDRFDFDVPVGTTGDNFDRYLVRVEEMKQSMRILDQA